MLYHEVRQLALSARDHRSKPIANNTRAEIVLDSVVAIRLHGTNVVTLFDNGSFSLSTGGWYTVTTKDRINSYLPGGVVRVGSHRPTRKSPARWWIFTPSWEPVAPFFDGITFTADGTIVNPKPDTDITVSVAAGEAFEKSITKYLDAYMKAAEDQIYVDALTQEPDGAMTCWDCSVVAHGRPELEGRTTEDGNKLAHLERHVGNREIVPELAWVAMAGQGLLRPRHPDVPQLVRHEHRPDGRPLPEARPQGSSGLPEGTPRRWHQWRPTGAVPEDRMSAAVLRVPARTLTGLSVTILAVWWDTATRAHYVLLVEEPHGHLRVENLQFLRYDQTRA